MRIVFMGTSDFALEALLMLHQKQKSIASIIVSVYTKAPKPKGRGYHMEFSPVHQYTLDHDLPVETPKTLRTEDSFEKLKSYRPDVIVVAAYGLIIPQNILDIPKYGCINIHGSLLPRWRGAAPIERALLAGDHMTGITIMQMDAGIDTGDIILKKELSIGEDEKFQNLFDRMKKLGAEMIVEVLKNIDHNCKEKQSEEGVIYAYKIESKESILSSKDSVFVNYNKIRTFKGCKWIYKDQDFFLIHEAHISKKDFCTEKTLWVEERKLYMACSDGWLEILKIQRPSKNILLTSEFLKGFRVV